MPEIAPRTYQLLREIRSLESDGESLKVVVFDDDLFIGERFRLHIDAEEFFGVVNFTPMVEVTGQGDHGLRVLTAGKDFAQGQPGPER